MKEEKVEAMAQILEEEGGVVIDNSLIEKIVAAYEMHTDNMREMESYAHIDYSERKCSKCESLKREIEDFENRERIWKNSVKNKIAGATRVYMNDRNEIKYDLV